MPSTIQSDSQIAKLSLGTAQFGLHYGIANTTGLISLKEGEAILNLAHSKGIDTLDTASVYGKSEERLGLIGINKWNVVTKVVAVPHGEDINAWLQIQLNESLVKLKQTNLYSLLLHRPNQLLESEGEIIYRQLKIFREQGIVQKIGISVYSPDQLKALVSRYQFDLVQLPLNIFDRRFERSGWLRSLSEMNIEIHARSAFLQGLLLMEPDDRPQKFDKWNLLWKDYDTWVKERKTSRLSECLNFVLSNEYISKVVVGIDSLVHIDEIVNTIKNLDKCLAPIPFWCDDDDLINPSRW